MKVAVALLKSQDGERLFFQRRKLTADVYPGHLSFFGGKLEEGEKPHEAINRELEEELGIGQVSLDHLVSFTALPTMLKRDNSVETHVFHGILDDSNISLEEGTSIEAFTLVDALARDDLVPTTRHVLEQLINDGIKQ